MATVMAERPQGFTATRPARMPKRVHHSAYVSADQERTRRFYEDLLGMPLVAFWVERSEVMGEMMEFSHALYGMADGSALAFFNFADPGRQARFTAKIQDMFVHLALAVDRLHQDDLHRRLQAAGHPVMVMDHGYVRSIYVRDPDGQLIEFTSDVMDAESIDREQRLTAHASLRRWLAGDRTPNNGHRPHD
jgi:glyoxylase I family protein